MTDEQNGSRRDLLPQSGHWQLVAGACEGQAERFRALCREPERVQDEYLRALIADNAAARFGSEHRFDDIAGYADFAATVPVGDYEQLKPYVERLTAGEQNELTAEPALFVELTGGSTGGAKVIPFTRGGLADYAAALHPWLSDLIARWPEVTRGRIYFALSPAGPRDAAIGTLPIGNPAQFNYFGDGGGSLAALSIVPHALAAVSDFADWQLATCVHLLAARDLALIWIWSPTYLAELVHAIQRRRKEILLHLGEGGRPDLPLPSPDPARAAELAPLIGEDRIDTGAIWPGLAVISCWMDASSTPFAAELQHSFPKAAFQAKGLMATEGATSLPLGDQPGCPLAIESGFFEFADGEGGIVPAAGLALGEVRRVILSNRSGLYRYDTGDLVEVVGFEDATPRLRFIGRSLTSDLCGEKLSEPFVIACLERVVGVDHYAFLAATREPRPHYQLWLDAAGPAPAEAAAALESVLGANPQYAYARRLGQLQPLTAHAADDLYEKYRAWALAAGRNLGHMKAPALLAEIPSDLVALLKGPA